MPWRPRIRFSLLTLFIAVTAIAVWLSMIANRAYRQRAAIERLERLGAAVFFDYQRNWQARLAVQ